MKFEKFFKSVGTHGLILVAQYRPWLMCDGVGMVIPEGVNNLGASVSPTPLFNAIINSETDNDTLTLSEAILKDPEGKAGDIIRVFESDYDERIGISNAHYGLLEKSDVLTYLEVEAEDPNNELETITTKIMVVRDYNGDVIGFITGVDFI
jgi:hypothetical protein